MGKRIIGIIFASVLSATPAFAVTGGQPDRDRHPYVAVLLVPGTFYCSGTLIDEDVVLTAGHCTDAFEDLGAEEVWVSFDAEAAVDPATFLPIPGTGRWFLASNWETHPNYVEPDWPFTADYGVVLLDAAVTGIAPARLPEPNQLDFIVDSQGQTQQRFQLVGFGSVAVPNVKGPPGEFSTFERYVTTQRFSPSNGQGKVFPLWLLLGAVPNPNHGGGCSGDSGGGIFLAETNTLVAVYSASQDQALCGRIADLGHRVDLPLVLDWLAAYQD